MISWKNGKPIVWEATFLDTLAQSYCCHATNSARAEANLAEERKERKSAKYISLGPGYLFTPVAIETLGAIVKRLQTFLKELGHRMRQCTGEVKVRAYLLQRLSVAVQQLLCWVQRGGGGSQDLFCI